MHSVVTAAVYAIYAIYILEPIYYSYNIFVHAHGRWSFCIPLIFHFNAKLCFFYVLEHAIKMQCFKNIHISSFVGYTEIGPYFYVFCLNY